MANQQNPNNNRPQQNPNEQERSPRQAGQQQDANFERNKQAKGVPANERAER